MEIDHKFPGESFEQNDCSYLIRRSRWNIISVQVKWLDRSLGEIIRHALKRDGDLLVSVDSFTEEQGLL